MNISDFYWISVYACFGSNLITHILNQRESKQLWTDIEKEQNGLFIAVIIVFGLPFVPVINTLVAFMQYADFFATKRES